MDYNNELNFGTTATRDRELSMSQAFPVLMRKVYVWMSLALAITGITAFGVANSPGVMSMIFGNQIVFWGLVIADNGKGSTARYLSQAFENFVRVQSDAALRQVAGQYA